MNASFLLTFSIIILGFVAGLIVQRYSGKLALWLSLVSTKIALMSLIPFSIFISLWQLKNIRLELFYLPLIGVCVIFTGIMVGVIIAKKKALTDIQMASLVSVTSMYNLGALGNLIVFTVFGEDGVAMLALFKLCEELIYYGGVFPFAKSKSPDMSMKETKNKQLWKDPIFLIALTAVSSGVLLNIFGIPRPLFLTSFTCWMIPLGTFLLVFSVGLTFNLKGGRKWRKLALFTMLIRNISVIVVLLILLSVFGLWDADYRLVSSVCLILGVMPTAFMSTLPSVIYGLDRDLANTSWIVSYGVSLIIIPLTLMYVTIFG